MKQRSFAIALTVLMISFMSSPVLAQADNRQQAQIRAQQVRQGVEDRVQKIRTTIEERRAQVKLDVCQRRQVQIQAVIPRLATSVNRLLSVMDSIYGRVQNFYENGQLTVSNYDQLKADVDAAKVNAEQAVLVVGEFSFTLDCDNPSVGLQLDGYRSVIKEAREALSNYRSALVKLISALRAADAEQEEDIDNADEPTSTGNQNEPDA